MSRMASNPKLFWKYHLQKTYFHFCFALIHLILSFSLSMWPRLLMIMKNMGLKRHPWGVPSLCSNGSVIYEVNLWTSQQSRAWQYSLNILLISWGDFNIGPFSDIRNKWRTSLLLKPMGQHCSGLIAIWSGTGWILSFH